MISLADNSVSPASLRAPPDGQWTSFIDWILSRELTVRQLRVIMAIKRFESFYADYPNLEELGSYTKMRADAVIQAAKQLERRGFVRRVLNAENYQREQAAKWRFEIVEGA